MTETDADQLHHPGQRIAKAMARAGLCSRRDAEAWILAGRVSVNGQKLASPAFNVVESDDIRVDGEPLKAHERTRLFLFHKPRGLVTTARDPEGRPTIFGALPDDLPRVVAVGRLDVNTEGLLLLTNDGGLARVLELPATGWLRRYRVRAHGAIDQAALDSLREGVTIEGIHYAGIDARLERTQGSNVWLTMGLREGKNREIKRVLESLGLSVNRLIRISFGPFELADLAEGEVVEARTRVLRDQLGPRLAREAGVDFDAPIVERAEPEPPPAPATETRRPPPSALRRPPPSALRRPARPGREEAAPRDAPRREPPRSAGPERKRKHVGALRAESDAAAAGPRKRIERSATSDRKGRVVAVERVLPTREEERRRELARRKAEARREGRVPRAGKSFQARDRAEGGERPLRRSSGGFGEERGGGETTSREDRAPRSPRAGKPYEPRNRAEGGERPPRRPAARFSEGRSAEGGGGEAAPHERKPFQPRNRAEGGERPPRRPAARFSEGRSTEGGGGEAAPHERKPFQPRNRAEGGERPPRRPAARFSEGRSAERSGRDATPREDRAPRASKPHEPRNRSEGRGPRDRAEGGQRPPRRPDARFGEGRGAERRSGEPPPREDHKPRKPRLNKPFAKRPFGGKGHGGPRKERPGGQRPPRRP
ncbi:MAG: pseudouridine synthase [Roseiarcus sp.]|uniref:pseudouridine synthase n=1 Tax=Roseiarcus sp. TaxID=1969460 RepID=UPI003C1B9286